MGVWQDMSIPLQFRRALSQKKLIEAARSLSRSGTPWRG